MELTESIESINRQLVDLFGIDTITGMPIWRVVWSDDQYEKRKVDCIAGIQLLHPVVKELPKYDWIRQRWILERLVLVPEINQDDLPASKLTYECMWKFEDKDGNPLPPAIWACKFVVDTIYAALGKSGLAKYKDEEETPETKMERVKNLEQELFGNETSVGDALAHKHGVTVPGLKEN